MTSRNWSGHEESETEPALVGAMESLEDDLALLSRRYVDDSVLADHYVTVVSAGPRNRRTQRLGQLIELLDRKIRGARPTAVAVAIRSLVSTWRNDQAVQAWAAQRLPLLLTDHLLDLFTGGYDSDRSYIITLALPGDEASFAGTLVKATAAHLESLTTTQLHAVARTLSDTLLNPETCGAVALSALTVQAQALPDSPPLVRARAARQARTAPPEDPTALLAAALWSLLGHEDRRYRWLAAHTTRLLLMADAETSLVRCLWGLAEAALTTPADRADDVSSFRTHDLEFLSLSAIQSLLLVLARVAHERPDVVKPVVGEIGRCAVSTAFPHVSIRELARRTALAVVAFDPQALPSERVERLGFANTPNACTVADSHRTGSNHDIDTRFDLDHMDTVRYWMEPLAEILDNITTADVAHRTDTWITDRWGRTNSTGQDSWIQRHGEDSWGMTRNDHGSMPTIELIDTYLEMHGLLCTAGDLVDEGTHLATDHARIRYTDPADAIGARLHYWNEEDLFRHRSQTAYQSSGDYLAIRKDVLTDFLRNTGSSLVISVHASLYFSSRRERESIHHAATCYLLIHADGTEERLNAITS